MLLLNMLETYTLSEVNLTQNLYYHRLIEVLLARCSSCDSTLHKCNIKPFMPTSSLKSDLVRKDDRHL